MNTGVWSCATAALYVATLPTLSIVNHWCQCVEESFIWQYVEGSTRVRGVFYAGLEDTARLERLMQGLGVCDIGVFNAGFGNLRYWSVCSLMFVFTALNIEWYRNGPQDPFVRPTEMNRHLVNVFKPLICMFCPLFVCSFFIYFQQS